MILYLTHGNGEESIPLKLPASSSQVDEIDIRLDDICSGEGNFRISDVKSSVKGLWQFIRSADLLDPEDLEKLNRLSRQIDTMSEKEHQIFAGALLSECISNLNDVLQTVGRIGQYGMIPKVTCDRELGGYLVEHGKIDCPEHLKPYLDYWAKLKQRLKEEGADQLLTNCQQLKMKSPKDGKRYNTDVADTEQLLRIVQSIPSPKAEPFRAWLAQVGRERIEETIDPELTIERALETYLKKGYTREWINQRLQAIQVRKELTDEWNARGVQKGVEYAILTDEISRAWSGMSTRQYKNLKGLKKENLRDNMTTLELVLNMLAEATTTQFSKDRKPTTFQENLEVAKAGGQVAGRTRKDIESQSNTPVISPKNAAQLNQVVTDLLEGAAADMSEMPEEK